MSITGTTYSVLLQIYIVSTTRILSCQLLVPPIIQFNGRYTLSVQPEFCHVNYWYHLLSCCMADIHCQYNQNFVMPIIGTTYYSVQWQIYIVSTTGICLVNYWYHLLSSSMADIHCQYNQNFFMPIIGTTYYPVQWQIYIVSTTRILSCQLLVPPIQFNSRYTLSVQSEFCHVNYWYNLSSSIILWQIYIVSTTRVLSCQLLVTLIQFNGIYTLSVQLEICHANYRYHLLSSSMADIHCQYNQISVMSITGTIYSVQLQIYIVSTTRILSSQLLVPPIQFNGRYTLSVHPEFCHVNNWYHLSSSLTDIHCQYNQSFVMSITGTTYSVQWQIYIVSTTRNLSSQLLVPPIQFNGRYTLSVQPEFCHVNYWYHLSSSMADIHCQYY